MKEQNKKKTSEPTGTTTQSTDVAPSAKDLLLTLVISGVVIAIGAAVYFCYMA